jgi:hypothetical protein
MLAEELVVLNANAPLWNAVQPLLNAALKLEQSNESYSLHGWTRADITTFLQELPAHCSLLAAVWEVEESQVRGGQDVQEREILSIGCVCEVLDGEVRSVRTFDALPDLPPVEQLEPGILHAVELMRVIRAQVAPVAWALFTDKKTWDEWLYAESDQGISIDKGDLLASLARQGRCVIMGSQTGNRFL